MSDLSIFLPSTYRHTPSERENENLISFERFKKLRKERSFHFSSLDVSTLWLTPLCNIKKFIASYRLLDIFCVAAAADLLPLSATGSGRSRNPFERFEKLRKERSFHFDNQEQ